MKLGVLRARRFSAFVALVALPALVVATAGSAARGELERVGTGSIVKSEWTPLGLSNKPVTVVLQMEGNPVTVRQAAVGRELSTAEKSAIEAVLAARQNAIKPAIENLGAKVLGDYQFAYNGIKVSAAPRQLAALEDLPNVVAVRSVQKMKPDNVRGVPLIGTPAVWDGVAGLHGENIKIAVIDTGVDYTHANFGGPGTTAAFEQADAADTLPPSPALGWGARVKGGTDLVGDDYDASADEGSPALIPHPDPNPLDCNGHGSHVAGSAAGSGVLADGDTYTGEYNAGTIAGNSWTIGPGVAPKADLYAVRVFGCEGSTDVTVDAIEWAVENGMDVINMSLGSTFGSKDDPSAVASTNAAKAGVVVVTSSGNDGPNQYITGSPGTAEGAISTAANDPSPTFPGVEIKAGALTINGINANEHPNPTVNGTLKVIVDNPDTPENESQGCSVEAFGGPLPEGTIAVVNRDNCARVAKAIFGEKAGAAAVIMVNNAPGLPPLEGPITSNPDTGEEFTVTIPFVGVAGPYSNPASDGGKLRAVPNGTPTTLAPKDLTNTNFKGFASFSSGGPRTGDSGLKPDITAPGVAIVSTGVGTGNGPARISGTSMASPHVAGVAALTVQAHPTWDVADIKKAIVNTGEPSEITGLTGHRISRGGTGLVQPQRSTKTMVVAGATGGDGFDVSLNFGYEELKGNYSKNGNILLHNFGASPATFDVAQANASGSPHTIGLNQSSITVPAGGNAVVVVNLSVPVASVGNSHGAGLSFREVAGLIAFTPTGGSNNGIALRVPYYLVPRALSEIQSRLLPGVFSATVNLSNKGAITTAADFYALGLEDHNEPGSSSGDVRAVGVQAFPDGGDSTIVFSVNTYDRWSNPSTNEYDIFVDVDNDGRNDYIVVGVDLGAVTAGSFNGLFASFVFSTRSDGADGFLAQAPSDSSTANLPALASQFCRDGEPCLSPSNPRFRYSVVSFDLLLDGAPDPVPGSARFNAFNPAFADFPFAVVPAGASGNVRVPFSLEFAITPPRGVMVTALDDKSGAEEADLLPFRGGR